MSKIDALCEKFERGELGPCEGADVHTVTGLLKSFFRASPVSWLSCVCVAGLGWLWRLCCLAPCPFP